jgi:hypothetical protein
LKRDEMAALSAQPLRQAAGLALMDESAVEFFDFIY